MAGPKISILKLPAVQRIAEKLATHDRWSREELLAYQKTRLKQVIAHAAAHSPYYREALGALGEGPKRLQDLPTLDKPLLMREFDRIVTDRRLNRAMVEEHVGKYGAAVPLLERYRVFPTGGSTGIRTLVVVSRPTRLIGIANTLRWTRVMGIEDQTRVVSIGAATPLHISNQISAELRGGRPDAPVLDVTMPISQLVAALNAYRPEVLIAYASILRALVLEQMAGRLAIKPRCCGSICETLAPEIRRLVRDVWGAPVIDSYATTETGQIGTDCDRVTGIHVMEELVVLEVVDENYKPVPPGVTGERLLITTLFNSVMPLIRYEITDRVAVTQAPCPCGRPHMRLLGIQGRAEEMLELPAKAGGTTRVAAVRFRDPLLLNTAVRQYQVVAAPGQLRVRVVLSPDIGDAAPVLQALHQAIATEMDRIGALPQALTVERVDRIERTAHAGKERLVARA
jgi:phenylacetate-CoA ligase